MSAEEVPTSMAELMGQMSDMVLVSGEGPMDQPLHQAMQVLTINSSTQIHQQPPQSIPKGIVWQGEIEWQYENPKIPIEFSSRLVPCQLLSKLTTVGEPELYRNTEEWPTTLRMELIAKPCNMHQFESTFLKESNNVFFHFSQNIESSEVLSSLKEEILKGFVGCILLPKQDSEICDFCILMLVSVNDLYTYVGFIPKDQTGVVDTYFNVMAKEQTSIKTAEKLKPQQQLVSQPVQRQLFGSVRKRPPYQPSNPDMGGSSVRTSRSRRPRFRRGVSVERNTSFVPGRITPYIHVPRLSPPPITGNRNYLGANAGNNERQNDLSSFRHIRVLELGAQTKKTPVQVESVLGRQQQHDMPSTFAEDEQGVLLFQLEQQLRLSANNTTNTNNQQVP